MQVIATSETGRAAESELVSKSLEILNGEYTSPYLIETLEKVIEGPLAKPKTSVH